MWTNLGLSVGHNVHDNCKVLIGEVIIRSCVCVYRLWHLAPKCVGKSTFTKCSVIKEPVYLLPILLENSDLIAKHNPSQQGY